MIFSTKPNRKETLLGFVYLAINLLILPGLLVSVHDSLGAPLTEGKLNFLFFFINFAAVTYIFRKYLLSSVRDAVKVIFPTLWYAALGYMGSLLLGQMVSTFCVILYPEFSNVNDGSIIAILQEDFAPMAIGTVLLVPVVEETFYRGLIFRGLYDRNPLAAYLVSMAFFSVIHVMGYIGQYAPMQLLLCFIQYLPAGYCLAFAYRYSGTIVAPILMHMAVNAAGIFAMR